MKKYFSEKNIFQKNLFFRRGRTHGVHVEHRCGPPQSFWWSVAVRFFLVLNCADLDIFGRARPTKTSPISKMKPMPTMIFFYVQVLTLKKLWSNFQLNRSSRKFLPLKPFVPNLA